jgi:RND family efflux transporter MFP subunit
MPTSEPNQIQDVDALRKEVEELRRRLQEREQDDHASRPAELWRPSAVTIWSIFLGCAILIAIAFLAGYLPHQRRTSLVRAETVQQEEALPRVDVIQVTRSSPKSELQLPGNIQALTEAPILARADGYLQRRVVDIGDRVRAGQLLAEITAPEIEQQIRQANAALDQAQAALEQAQANFEQGKANRDLARVTSERWTKLESQGIVSHQETDQYRTQFQVQEANVHALDKAVSAQRSNIAAAEANLGRLKELKSYLQVKAPFDGVITLRNVDVGALVNSGNTLLFRIAQTETVRTYVNVPQSNASFIHDGQPAVLTVSNLPGRSFSGKVVRTANALDPTSRTMLVEVQVPNTGGALLPGMYAQVDLSSARTITPLLIPGDALIARAEGPQVALVRPDHTVHLQNVQVGRDYGARMEILGGLQAGDTIIPNPSESAREGLKVDPVPAASTK